MTIRLTMMMIVIKIIVNNSKEMDGKCWKPEVMLSSLLYYLTKSLNARETNNSNNNNNNNNNNNGMNQRCKVI